MAGQVFYKRKGDGLLIPINPGPRGEKGDKGDKGDTGAPGVDGQDFTPTDADARYVNTDGNDTMNGVLTVKGAGGVGPGQIILDGENGITNLHMYADGVQAYRLATIDGRMRIYGADRGSGALETYSFYNNNKVYQRGEQNFSQADLVIMPIPTAAQQVPRLARTPNPTTGDLGLPGYAGSDTGWRDVSADIYDVHPDLSSISLRMRRHGVYVDYTVAWNSAASGNILAFKYDPPRGFRYAYSIVDSKWSFWGSAGAWEGGAYTVVGGSTIQFTAGTIGVRSSFSHIIQSNADLVWPSSLPGTEITPPAQWT